MAAFLWLLGLVLRSTVVVGVALALALLLRRASAAARHRLLTLTAVGLLLLPALPALLPSWELPFVISRGEPAPEAPSAALPLPAGKEITTPLPDAPADTVAPSRDAASFRNARSEFGRSSLGAIAARSRGLTASGTAAVIVWLAGVLASLAGLGRALSRERRLLRQARPLAGPWGESLAEAQRVIGVPGPVRLLVSEEVQTPLTGGWLRPAVLLPASAESWPEERRRLVAQHELLHVVRADAARHLAWRLVAAVYWFHPLALLAGRRARLASEQACDETVVHLGARPSSYARHLLEIAESLGARPAPALASALPMIERSQLERRLVMILDPTPTSRFGRAAGALGLALLVGTVIGAAAAVTGHGPAAVAAAPAVVAEVEPAPPEGDWPGCPDGMDGNFSRHDDRNGEFSIQTRLGAGQQLCARVRGPVRFDERDGSIREMPRGGSVLIETREGQGSQRMLITADDGAPRHQWWLNGESRAVDDAARAWLADALETVVAMNAIGKIQGQVGSLQGQIGSIQGEVGSLQGEIGSIQGQVGSLQGRIGSIQGEQGSLQGAIGSHQGAIGGLQAARSQASESLRQQLDREIETHEAAIRKLKAEIASRDFSGRIEQAKAELRSYEDKSDGQIAQIRRRIEDVQAEKRITALQRQIEDLHAEDRIREIQTRSKPARERLKEHVTRLSR